MLKHLSIFITAAAVALTFSAGAEAATNKAKIRFSASSYVVAENAGSATVSITRSPRNGKAHSQLGTEASVGFATSNGTAIAGADYTAVAKRVTFPACPANPAPDNPCLVQTVAVPIGDDAIVDGNKTVKLALTAPSRTAVVVNPQKATLTIADNEGPNTVQLDASAYHVWESDGQAELHVIRSGAGITGSSSVNFSTSDGTAVAPGDYTSKSVTVSFGPGEVDKTVLVDITPDTSAEPNETFNATLSSPSAGTSISGGSASVTIMDDDSAPASVGFDVASYSVGEGGDVTITVVRTGTIDSSVSVDYATAAGTATADVDYTSDADTLSFDPGDVSESFTISSISDSLHEGDETFAVGLANAVPSGTGIATSSTVVTIADDDPVPTVSVGAGSASNGSASFDIQLSNPSTTDVTVDYTITDAAGNVVATGTATIPAGSSSTTVTTPVTGDGPWSIWLSNPSGGTLDPSASSSSTAPASSGTPGTTTTTGGSASTGTTSGGGSSSIAAGSGEAAVPVKSAADSQLVLAARQSACKLSVKPARRVDRRKGLVVRLKAARGCVVTLGASVRGIGGKHSTSTRVVRALKTKRQTIHLAKGKARTLTLRFSKRGIGFIRRALEAHRRMTLTLVVIEKDVRNRVSKRTTRTRLHR